MNLIYRGEADIAYPHFLRADRPIVVIALRHRLLELIVVFPGPYASRRSAYKLGSIERGEFVHIDLAAKGPIEKAFVSLEYMAFPAQHRTKLHSTNPLERLNKEVKRRADVVGIFPTEDRIVRLIGAVLLEANDEWQLQHRYMQVEAMADLNTPAIEEEKPLQITPKAA